MPHTFAMDYALYPEAENAMNEILTFIRNVLDLRQRKANRRCVNRWGSKQSQCQAARLL